MDRDPYSVGADEILFEEFDRWVIAARRYRAAKRSLGLVNKLRPGPTRARHVSRVMANMNRLRAQFNYYKNIFEGADYGW